MAVSFVVVVLDISVMAVVMLDSWVEFMAA